MAKTTESSLRAVFEVLTAGSQLPVRAMEQLIRGDERGEQLLIEVLRSRAVRDESWGPIWAIVALGERRSARALPFILECMLNGTDMVHEAVEFALLRYGAGAIDALLRFMDENPGLEGRVHLYSALATSRAPQAIDYLIAQLRRDEDCTASVAWALATTRDPRAVAAIEREVERTPKHDPELDEALAAARGDEDLRNPLLEDWRTHWVFEDAPAEESDVEHDLETMRDEDAGGLNLQPRFFDVHCPVCESQLEYDSVENETRVLKRLKRG